MVGSGSVSTSWTLFLADGKNCYTGFEDRERHRVALHLRIRLKLPKTKYLRKAPVNSGFSVSTAWSWPPGLGSSTARPPRHRISAGWPKRSYTRGGVGEVHNDRGTDPIQLVRHGDRFGQLLQQGLEPGDPGPRDQRLLINLRFLMVEEAIHSDLDQERGLRLGLRLGLR